MWKLAISPDPPLAAGEDEPPDGLALATGEALATVPGEADAAADAPRPARIGADEDEGDQQYERDDDAGYEACGDR